jgi:hypothetical protein
MDNITPGATDLVTYDRLIAVVKEASQQPRRLIRVGYGTSARLRYRPHGAEPGEAP